MSLLSPAQPVEVDPFFGYDKTTTVIPNPEALVHKISQIAVEDLHIIADFDMTLTRHTLASGKRGSSTHVIVQNNKAFGDDFRQTSRSLFEKYYPVEIDDSISTEEKEPMMVEWWTAAHEIMVQAKLHKDQLTEIGSSPDLQLRERAKELFTLAQQLGIPFHVFSAGIRDVIVAAFEHWGVNKLGVHVVSNMMDWDDATGYLRGFTGELIHTLNKNSKALQGRLHCQNLSTWYAHAAIQQEWPHAFSLEHSQSLSVLHNDSRILAW
eukprot:m.101653 g.101653  ORF g.101653 m.101653 type:complete len:266 (-) comp16815_c0_seq1:534-1331(-)